MRKLCILKITGKLWTLITILAYVLKHSMIGDRAFPIATAKGWNNLPATSHLRRHCYPSNGDWKLYFLSAAIHPSMSNNYGIMVLCFTVLLRDLEAFLHFVTIVAFLITCTSNTRAEDGPLFLGLARFVIGPACCMQSTADPFSFWSGLYPEAINFLDLRLACTLLGWLAGLSRLNWTLYGWLRLNKFMAAVSGKFWVRLKMGQS